MTQIDHAESHSANHFRGPFRQKLPGTWCTVHPYAHEDLFLVFDFRFVFSSFGHENIFFCADYENSNVRNTTICTFGQIDHYRLYKVITFQIFDFISKF